MKTKIALILIGLLFGVPFFLGGVIVGAWPMAETLYNWKQTRSWQKVPATVLEVELDRHSRKKATTYQVTVRYRYEFGAGVHESEKIGLGDDDADNVGSWHQDWHRALKRKMRTREPIAVWVNPGDPSQAVIDRDIRWPKLLFMLPFAILFPAVGIGALWFAWNALRIPASEMESNTVKPNPEVISSDGGSAAAGMWIFASFWGLISFPIAILSFLNADIPWFVRVLILLFPAIGIWLFRSAIRRTLAWRRFGSLQLRLAPGQPRLGETLAGTIQFERFEEPTGEYTLMLVCEQVNSRRRGPSSERIWWQERQAQRMGDMLHFGFEVPSDMSASQPYGSSHYRWQLRIKNEEMPEQNFDINVFPVQDRL